MVQSISKPCGFTLIEFLVSTAILSIVAIGTIKVAAEMADMSIKQDLVQQRTGQVQSLHTVFDNAEICTNILAGTPSSNGATVNLPSELSTIDIFKRLDLESVKIQDIQNLSGGFAHANIEVITRPKGNPETSSFTSLIPVFYKTTAGAITECLSTRSAYSTCMALKGTWTSSACDLCSSLGGTREADGSCSLASAPVAPTPTPPQKFVILRRQGAFNGSYTFNIGNYRQCNLIRAQYDGSSEGACVVMKPAARWQLRIVDEGDSNPQVCTLICVSNTAVDMGGIEDGDLCNYNSKPGIVYGGCCNTGTTWSIYPSIGGGKSGPRRPGSRTNDIGCFK